MTKNKMYMTSETVAIRKKKENNEGNLGWTKHK